MTTSGRDRAGRYCRTLTGATRDSRACEMRAAGHSYERISTELGYGNRSNARRAVTNVLAETVQEASSELRQLALMELDAMAREAWRVLRATHLVISHGKVVRRDGQPIPDDGPTLAAIDRLLKISERRSRLLGLDAPALARIETITVSEIDAEIEKLTAELAAGDYREIDALDGRSGTEGLGDD